MATPKEHIEEIRRKKFSIGGEENPLIGDLHQTVKLVSAELYTKDVHFLMELIQNAEDNAYLEGVDPSLEFVITSRDITCTGAPATLLIFNNEKGFSAKNVESVCSAGRSTKKGKRKQGYIGEKGIGFKSVFLITARPHIFSNGYQIRFNEEPCPSCNLGYIVPEWVEDKPSLSDINQIYGLGSTLPTTTIILPLKPDKVAAVKQQLSSVHPEVLLFLCKIKRLSVRENNENPRLSTVTSIAINSETDFVTRKNIDAESYTLILSANGKEFRDECSYYMWKQKFPVKPENKVERRMEVEDCAITLAFPHGKRLQRGSTSPGIYAFLPTEMVTNFPFIIQADFLLASSRETIVLDNKWNKGILDCVSTAFVNALVSLVKMTNYAPASTLARTFSFLPVNNSTYKELNTVREAIRAKLVEENIVPSESYMEQKFFHKPREVGRLMPSFWDILKKAKEQGVSLKDLSSHGIWVLNYSLDSIEYDPVLNFLGVGQVDSEWYAKCIQSSNLISEVSDNVYLELLVFLAENWSSKFLNTNILTLPLIKYVGADGNIALSSINERRQNKNMRVVCLSYNMSWLIDWNREFKCVANRFFMPNSTYSAIEFCSRRETVLKWLKNQANVVDLTVYEYADVLVSYINNDQNLSIAYSHFLYYSFSSNLLSSEQVDKLCDSMPLVDNYGKVNMRRNGVLVPANGSKWAELIGYNPWIQEGYIVLGDDYQRPLSLAGRSSSGNLVMDFLKSHVKASDIPDLKPPNCVISVFSGPLTKQNAFLLLDWIKSLKYRGLYIPEDFLACVRNGSWLKVNMHGSSGYRPPAQSFILGLKGNVLQNGSVLVDIPLVDKGFYGESINKYKEELKTIGVMFEDGEACRFIGQRLMTLASSSSISRGNMFSILSFIKFLSHNYLPVDNFINSIKEERWLKTCHGYRSPVGSVLFDLEWKVISQISNIPFIDQEYYGDELLSFKEELQLLGVIVGFNEKHYQLIIDNLKLSSHLTSLSAEALLLLLRCIRHLKTPEKIVRALRQTKCMKTNTGYQSPSGCFLFDPLWGCLLQVFDDFPIVDQNFYGGRIISWKEELKQVGVLVDYEEAVNVFASRFRQRSPTSISKNNVMSLLSCYRKLKKIPSLMNCAQGVKWLRTKLGDYRCPRDCVLFGPDWESISPITVLPFIDDSENYYGKAIHEYKAELKSLGVIVEFKDGAKIVSVGLCFPPYPISIKSENALSLLNCVKMLQKKGDPLSESFLKKVSEKWLKTKAGYRSPNECLLFDSEWSSILKPTDGPFIDEEFYGDEIKSYKKELNGIGVTGDAQKGCSLLSGHLAFCSDFASIVRVYNFLGKFEWLPSNDDQKRIWIPNGRENGNWVNPAECVLHDKDELFSLQLNVLDKHYGFNLLSFFSCAFGVRSYPSVDDYCKLWKTWESSREQLSNTECCAFWGAVTRYWSPKAEMLLKDGLVKLPVDSGSDVILLRDKGNVFIADDLQLKDILENSSHGSLFVWVPKHSLPGLPRTKLLEIYGKVGVRKLSESVQKEELSFEKSEDLKQLKLRDDFIGRGLIRLVLGFLAYPSLNLEAEKRHESVNCLLKLMLLETMNPISMRYSLRLSSGETVDVIADQLIRWDKESSKFFTQKLDRSSGQKNLIEYATFFSEVVSKGVLWDREEHIKELSELIKLAFLLEFDEAAVGFLLKSKNLQIFLEDEQFLSAAFASE